LGVQELPEALKAFGSSEHQRATFPEQHGVDTSPIRRMDVSQQAPVFVSPDLVIAKLHLSSFHQLLVPAPRLEGIAVAGAPFVIHLRRVDSQIAHLVSGIQEHGIPVVHPNDPSVFREARSPKGRQRQENQHRKAQCAKKPRK
jgi:hypothetical protein